MLDELAKPKQVLLAEGLEIKDMSILIVKNTFDYAKNNQGRNVFYKRIERTCCGTRKSMRIDSLQKLIESGHEKCVECRALDAKASERIGIVQPSWMRPSIKPMTFKQRIALHVGL